MRARNIKPGFFKNELLAELKFESRILFAGLWCLADRRGILEDRPKKIKAEIFPYDPKTDINEMLDALQSRGFIVRYTASQGPAIYLPTFSVHNNPHHREKENGIDKFDAKNQVALGQTRASLGNSGTSRDESGIRNPESGILNHGAQGFETEFVSLWKRYPRPLGRKQALKHFSATVKTVESCAAINKALDNYLAYLEAEKTDPKFIKHGSTWFNNWEEWTEYKPKENVYL